MNNNQKFITVSLSIIKSYVQNDGILNALYLVLGVINLSFTTAVTTVKLGE